MNGLTEEFLCFVRRRPKCGGIFNRRVSKLYDEFFIYISKAKEIVIFNLHLCGIVGEGLKESSGRVCNMGTICMCYAGIDLKIVQHLNKNLLELKRMDMK